MQFTGDGDTHTEACFNTEAASNSITAARSAFSFDATADAYRLTTVGQATGAAPE
jgi:hypothetical protein